MALFSLFFAGVQQDFKILWLAPLVCALFRAVFIYVYSPRKNPAGQWKKLYHCFRYGFWWGMDFNAYVFAIGMLAVSLPGAFFPAWFAIGDTLRSAGGLVYLAVLYTAFMGKMIFYFHYHDIYNHILWLGKKADKNNLADIFFNQNHGGWILLGYLPYLALCWFAAQGLLGLPSLTYPDFDQVVLHYGFNVLVVLAAAALFYYCRFGGTFRHADKPEWDEIPSVVKQDVFLAKATVDDLVALEIVWKHPLQELLEHTDEQAAPAIRTVLPAAWQEKWQSSVSPLEAFRREAKGARIAKPKHIFILFGESYAQAPFDPIYETLHIVEGGKAFRRNPHTVAIDNFLPGGEISQPSLVSLLSGIYDAGLELNERGDFWQGTVPTALPVQLRQLGYRTVFWYGGGMNWGSLQHYIPANGFDAYMDATEFCPKGSPRTWLGVYDHIFLENAARIIKDTEDDRPVVHFLYTTSNHGPYKMPLEKMGYSPEKIMPEAPEAVKKDAAWQRHLGVYWYADRALAAFAKDMQETYPDSLIVMTGDHSMGVIPFEDGIVERKGPTVREQVCTSFAMYHRELTADMFAGNTIGSHGNILATLIELIAPAGHAYYSLQPSLLEPIDRIVTPYHWLTREAVGRHEDDFWQSLEITGKELPVQRGAKPYEKERAAWCELTGWMARHPELLDIEK